MDVVIKHIPMEVMKTTVLENQKPCHFSKRWSDKQGKDVFHSMEEMWRHREGGGKGISSPFAPARIELGIALVTPKFLAFAEDLFVGCIYKALFTIRHSSSSIKLITNL